MRTNKYVVDRVSASRLGLLTGFTTAVAVCLWGVSVSADVIDIDLTGNQSGSVEASRRFFVPGDSPEAHFNTPTGAFDEQVFGQGAPIPGSKGVAWWDVEFKVTRTPDQTGDEMITIDKVVTNFTGVKWRDFHVTLGRGVDPEFMESDDSDNLYFKTDPAPMDELGLFQLDPNMPYDDPNRPNSVWFVGGLDPDQLTAIWLGINVPDELFEFDPATDTQMATFTIRQHATIPEPSGIALAILASVALWGARKRRLIRIPLH